MSEPLERLYAATTAIGSAIDDEQALLGRIVRELAALLDAKYAALGILGEDGALIHFETTGLTDEEEALLRPQPPHGRGILGALLREGHPLRLDDLTKDPRSVGFPAGHPPMRTFLGAPLVVGERVLGRLYVTEKHGGRHFTQEDETLALGFAAAAAVALQSARQAAQLVRSERLRATGELAAGVAHDFNNLLATILGRTEVLLGQVRDPEQRDSLEAIRRAARDGAAVVSRMREYSRPVDTTEFRLSDLADVARDAIQLARPRWQGEAQRQGRTITVQERLHSAPVLGDPAALREAVINLLFNATDALPSGGTITVSLEKTDNAALLSVADTGIGIPEPVRARIFDAFFTTKGAQGSGLGLAMVRKVIEAHGGTVSVESTPGQGATFTIMLPTAAGEPVHDGIAFDETRVPPSHVVVVDDQQDVLDTMGLLLRRDGHDVRLYHDPHAAVEAISGEKPDVVITDIGMPGMSGWQLTRAVRERHPDLPVIVLTGWGRDVTAAQLKEHGVVTALSKPAELDTFRRALALALAKQAAAPLRVLLVDDAVAFASVLSVLIGQDGHTVQRVETAGAAIDLFTSGERFDLVMLDLNLPDRPSAEVLAAARASASAPVVCVASGSAPHAMQREVPGADLYVEKAYVTEQLERILQTAQDRRPPA